MNIPFVIAADEIERLRQESGMSIQALLSTLVQPTCGLARPPISRFRVGAVGLGGSSGRVFRGVNLEFPGLPLHQSVHAEQFMVANMAQNAETSIRYLAVSAAPCGHCRQFLQELRGASDVEVLIVDDKNSESEQLSRFLPHRFGPDDLLAQDLDFPLLLEPRNNRLCLAIQDLEDHCSSSMSNGSLNGFHQHQGYKLLPGAAALEIKIQKSVISRLRDAALEAANKSYAPYTNCPSGVAILAKNSSEIFAGSYCESAAYNPSLPPLQAAIVAFVANGGGSYEDFQCAVLVEKLGASVQQAATVRMVLDQISPLCPLFVFNVKCMD